jgi:hypothetical protein
MKIITLGQKSTQIPDRIIHVSDRQVTLIRVLARELGSAPPIQAVFDAGKEIRPAM